MRQLLTFIGISFIILSCQEKQPTTSDEPQKNQLTGTWKLLSGTLIEKGDTVVTDYTKDVSMIKIINDTHFAFLNHDLKKGKDSTASFVAGGGTYNLSDSTYTEHLEYCTARDWEGHDFSFTVKLTGDTLVQSGIEKNRQPGD